MCDPNEATITEMRHRRRHVRKKSSDSLPLFEFQPSSKVADLGCFLAYLCSTTVLNLPIILLPVAAAERTSHVSSFVANVASVAVFGSAVGKLVNGFVCEEFGSQRSSFWYMIGLSLCTKLFASGELRFGNAGMEFFAAIHWPSLSVFLERKYRHDAIGYSKAVASLSLASTGGQFISKTIGVILLQYFPWQTIANSASLVALFGSLVVLVTIREPKQFDKEPFSFSKVKQDSAELAASPMFWAVGLAHAASMLGRSNDRVLGAFFHHQTSFSPRICGGLTLCSTIGLVYGLRTGRKFIKLDTKQKRLFLLRRYLGAILSALSLAICAALPRLPTAIQVLWIASSGFGLACEMSFLFFHIPNLVSKTFNAQAICLCALDAIGSLGSAPVWRYFGIFAAIYGFPASWVMIAGVMAFGGVLMIWGTKRLFA